MANFVARIYDFCTYTVIMNVELSKLFMNKLLLVFVLFLFIGWRIHRISGAGARIISSLSIKYHLLLHMLIFFHGFPHKTIYFHCWSHLFPAFCVEEYSFSYPDFCSYSFSVLTRQIYPFWKNPPEKS